MATKLRKCKAIGKAKGFESCGELSIIKLKGMCSNCFRKWVTTTKIGAEYFKINND